MRCFRIASCSLLFLACVSSTLFLHASSMGPVDAATHTKSSSNLIRVWTVGSPHTGELPRAFVPPKLLQRAQNLGYTIEVETFRASGFATKFRQAIEDHNEPEVLAFNNYGVLSGIQTARGWFDGVDSQGRVSSSFALVHESLNPLQEPGWVMLIPSAANYEAALALSMVPAECEAQRQPAADSPPIEPALQQAQEKAVRATRAYLDCDRSTLSGISDESRLGQQCFMPKSDIKVSLVKACRVSGNDRLAFVSLVSNFTAKLREPNAFLPARQGMDLGQQSILAVLRNQGGTWRLLAITHDPLNTWAQRALTKPYLFVNSLDQDQPTGIMLVPSQLVTPDGVDPLPERGERFGDFVWQPNQSSDVIGQVVEFTWGKNTNWNLTRLFFLPPSENKLSSGQLMSGGATTWRVWSISRTGDVAFSDQHSFMNR